MRLFVDGRSVGAAKGWNSCKDAHLPRPEGNRFPRSGEWLH